MQDSTSYFYHLTGGLPVSELSAGLTFAMIGLLLMTGLNVRKGIRNNPNTDYKFNLSHFGWDSLFRMLLSAGITLILVFISIRFVTELTGKSLTMFYCFLLGMGIDKATQLIVSKVK